MSKLVEWVDVKPLMHHISSNNLDNPQQSACSTGLFTETTLLRVKNKINLSLSCGEPTAMIFQLFSTQLTMILFLSHGLGYSMLKFNPGKTEFIIFGSHAHLKKSDSHLPVKNLGVWFGFNFSFIDHDCNICKTCFSQTHDIGRVAQYMTDEAVILAANALVSSLDYCNSFVRSLSSFNMCKLQYTQNTLAKIVTNSKR